MRRLLNPRRSRAFRGPGQHGIVDGIAGDQRLTGRVLNIDKSVAVKVVLRPGDGGRTTVTGQIVIQIGGGFHILVLDRRDH